MVLHRWHEKYAYWPSIRDLMELTDTYSSSTIHQHLEILRVKGLLSHAPPEDYTTRPNRCWRINHARVAFAWVDGYYGPYLWAEMVGRGTVAR